MCNKLRVQHPLRESYQEQQVRIQLQLVGLTPYRGRGRPPSARPASGRPSCPCTCAAARSSPEPAHTATASSASPAFCDVQCRLHTCYAPEEADGEYAQNSRLSPITLGGEGKHGHKSRGHRYSAVPFRGLLSWTNYSAGTRPFMKARRLIVQSKGNNSASSSGPGGGCA